MQGRELGPDKGQQGVGARMEREGASLRLQGRCRMQLLCPLGLRPGRPGSALHEGPPAVRGDITAWPAPSGPHRVPLGTGFSRASSSYQQQP